MATSSRANRAARANIAALAGLAKTYVATGAIDQAKQTLAMVPESKRNDAAVKAVQASIRLQQGFLRQVVGFCEIAG